MSLRDSELYRLFDRSPIGMYRCDPSGRFRYVNAALVRLLGHDSADDVLALTSWRDVCVDPAERERLLEHHRPTGAGEGARLRWRTRQGREVTVQIFGHIVEHAGGVSLDASVLDVTSHSVLERRMVDAQRAESLGVLAGGLAHDFNSLLAAILGNADLALRELAPRAPGHAALDNIRQAGLRAAELIDRLLACAGHGGVAPIRVAVAPVIDELVRISAPTMPASVGIRVDVARDLVLCGDATQVRQVVLNLLNNARDALRARGGTIAISGQLRRHDGALHPDDVIPAAAGSFVELEVADDGPGMSWETRRRIFEPFFSTKPTGHGLGLAAVAGIMRAHGGGLRLVTSPGQGARFQVLWPSAFTPNELGAVAPSTGQTVLVIDDEHLVRDVVARMIEDLGYAAITATDGPAGLAIVDHLQVDAVLVDLTLPRMAGTDVVTALRARRPELPIIVCSGLARDARALRADAYLPKPFLLDSLDDTLARLLPRARIQDGIRNHSDGNCEM